MDRCIALLIAAFLVVPCSAKLITVDDDGPADYQVIQEAINSSADGDTIVVRPGTYREQVGFSGRRVTVRSEDPDDPAVVQATVITSDSGSSVFFDFGEGNLSVLEGFTITGRGIFCAGTSPTISKNVVRDCAGAGIAGESDAAPVIVGNTITANALEGIHECDGWIRENTISQNNIGVAYCNGSIRDNLVSDHELEGIYGCDGPIEGNTIVRNVAGIAYANGLIRNNYIAENGNAGGLYYCNGDIVGNVIVDNTASPDGGGLFGCHGTIRNNVIAGNRADGDGGGLYDCSELICNNTIVGNLAIARGGGLAQCSARVCNNIIAYNEATLAGGIFGLSSNTYNAFWANAGGNFGGSATSGAGDVVVNPQFATEGHWDDGGTETIEDDIWTQGDYHLISQVGRWEPEAGQWVIDDVTSACVDAGDPGTSWVAELWPHGRRVNLGAYGGTPQASWSLSGVGHPSDLNHDGQIDALDLGLLAGAWLSEEDLQAEDVNRNGAVDFNDFAILAQSWRMGPPPASPPTPNPMTFATAPHGTGPYSMAMVAATAVSTDGTGIEYYFEDASNPATHSGWLTFVAGQEPRWEVTDLVANTRYWYRVKARNRGNLLETDWSERASGLTEVADFLAPTPDPMTWETEPYGSASDTIRMVATTAADPSGVEYRFECTSHPEFSGDWQDSRIYEVTSVPHGRYTFIVRARDKSAAQNAATHSALVTVDLQPPTPDPMEWEVEPVEVKLGNDLQYGAMMTAVQATDDAADVEYYFECTTRSGFSSGWQESREYTVLLGRKGQRQHFRVKARDTSSSHNETGWSSEVIAQ